MNIDARLLDVAIGETPGTVERIENVGRRVGAAQLFRLARVLKTDVAYFFSEGEAAGPPASPDTSGAPAGDSRLAGEAQRFARAFAAIDDADVRETVRGLLDALAEGGGDRAASGPEGAPITPWPSDDEPGGDRGG